MRTVVESPAAALRRELGLPSVTGSRQRRQGDDLKFRCGDRVFAKVDPRHIGRVVAIHHNTWLLVRWDKTGWLSELRPEEMESAK